MTKLALFSGGIKARMIVVALAFIGATAFVLSPYRAAQAALIHDYELNGTYADSFGGPSIVDNGGTIGPTGYTFAADQGPNLSNAMPASNYSIEIGFFIDNTVNYKKLIDFKDRTSDNGIYNSDTALDFFPFIPGAQGAFAAGVPVTLLVTRDGITARVIGYINGVQQFSFVDSANDATFTGTNNIAHFLRDDTVTAGAENPSGFLDYVRIYDTPITPEQDPDSGFVPPDKKTAKCEDTVAGHLKKLAACVTRCQVKQADFALKGKFFDEEACEQGAGKPVSCRAAYDKATAALLGLKTPICPICLDATAQNTLADLATNFLENNNDQVYCAGTSKFGGDDNGFIPPDKMTAKCEDTVARHLKKLAACVTRCQVKQADFALKGKFFDEEACEQGAGKPVSCRAAYDKATAALLGLKTPICPICLDATAQNTLADLVTTFIENNNGQIYCAGTTPLP